MDPTLVNMFAELTIEKDTIQNGDVSSKWGSGVRLCLGLSLF